MEECSVDPRQHGEATQVLVQLKICCTLVIICGVKSEMLDYESFTFLNEYEMIRLKNF